MKTTERLKTELAIPPKINRIMRHSNAGRILLYFFLMNLSVWSGNAAELRMKSQCTVTSSLVRLGDVVEVSGADAVEAVELRDIELFPAPTSGRKRELTRREIQELLTLQGIDLIQHRFTGAEQTSLRSVATTKVSDFAAIRKTSTFTNQRSVTTATPVAKQPQLLRPTYEYVVAVQGLQRGQLIRAEDVKLRSFHRRVASGIVLIDQILGKQAVRTISSNVPITPRDIRAPLLVQRNESVTLVARAPGVRVTTAAKCLDDGASGDLVQVQPFNSRGRLMARVVDTKRVEIYAAGEQVTE